MAPRHSLTDTYRSMAHLRRFFESVRRTITTEPTNGGLTPAQQFALLTLAGNPSNDPLTIGDLARSIRRTRAEVVFIVAKVSSARSPIVRGSFEGLPASVRRANCWAGVRPPFVGSVVI